MRARANPAKIGKAPGRSGAGKVGRKGKEGQESRAAEANRELGKIGKNARLHPQRRAGHITDTCGSAIRGRSLCCTISQDISTIWHPKCVIKTPSHEGHLAGNVETCTHNNLCHSRGRHKHSSSDYKSQHRAQQSWAGSRALPM
jgi:hypothetical protein